MCLINAAPSALLIRWWHLFLGRCPRLLHFAPLALYSLATGSRFRTSELDPLLRLYPHLKWMLYLYHLGNKVRSCD